MTDDKKPPRVSRLTRGGGRRPPRTLSRSLRYRPHRTQLHIEELIGEVVRDHGLTDAVRPHFVCLFWTEIAGEPFGAKMFPVSYTNGVLHLDATTSSWVHEAQFHRARLVAKINEWEIANRIWLGPSPMVTELRIGLTMRRRETLVDSEYVRRLRWLRRTMPRTAIAPPPPASGLELETIRSEVSTVEDAALRAEIEAVRVRWNL